MDIKDLLTILPVIFLIAWALLLLLVDLWLPANRKSITPLFTALGLALAMGLALSLSGRSAISFNNMAILDGFAVMLNVIILSSGLAAVALAYDYMKRMNIARGEYYVLLLFSIAGMILMVQAYDLILVFLALELVSIPLYVLAGFAKGRLTSEESALKYFLLGAFSSGFLLYGTALVYGATAHTNLGDIIAAIKDSSYSPFLMSAGSLFILVGFGFKVAAAPFHMWTPDVYQGAPSPVAGFMSVGVKAAAFAAFLRVFLTAFPSLQSQMTPALWALAALTMVIGNVLALVQTNIKRMLAYSSIAHAGYLLVALVPYGNGEIASQSVSAMLLYLGIYALGSFAAWAVVIAREQPDEQGLNIDDFAGLAKHSPWLAFAMLVAMLSFTGIPLTLGFWGKFFLFRAAVDGGFLGLALVGLVASLVSAYYYLRVVVTVYMRPASAANKPAMRSNPWVTLTAVMSAAAVLILAFIPNVLVELVSTAVLRLQ
ncbi:MAG TPA: NADH-quinone oxidoreductase subunit N [Anaerolineaceae bacterium]